jgi:hypothetical protein
VVTVPPIVHDVLNSPGQPLDAATRAFMEPRFGHDFSKVRVHADARAAEAASSIDARAFTSNGSVVFDAREYTPHTESGRRLLSHELTHVVQQQAGRHPMDGVHETAEKGDASAPTVQRQIAKEKPKKVGKPATSPGEYQWNPSPAPEAFTSLPTVPTYSGEVPQSWQFTGTKSLKQVQEEVGKIGYGLKAGIFANASLDVTVPVPDVPGLYIIIQFEGKYAHYGDDKKGSVLQQELELKQTIGVKWELFDIISFEADLFQYLKLEGENLGEAFVDAVKQIAYKILIDQGIDEDFRKLATWRDLSAVGKIKDLGMDIWRHPILFRQIQFVKLASSVVSPQEIKKAYDAYSRFFKNNDKVGFEYGIGAAASAKAEAGGFEAQLSAEAIVGIEDSEEVKAAKFAEVAFAGGVTMHDSDLKFRFAKRWREDGSERVKLDLEGEFPGLAGAGKQIESNVKLFLKSGACLNALRATAASHKEGEDKKMDINAIAQTAAIIIPFKAGDRKEKFGLDISIENTMSGGKSAWKGSVRIKEMQEFKSGMKPAGVGVEMKVKYGTFIDISAEIEAYLNEIYAGESLKFATLKDAYADFCAAVPKPYKPIPYAKFAEICKTPSTYERFKPAFLKVYQKNVGAGKTTH